MDFKTDENALQIITRSFVNYQTKLSNSTFIYVYYDSIDRCYRESQLTFLDRNYKHLCGISDKKEDIQEYTNKGINKEVISGAEFAKRLKRSRLGLKNIICKKDGSTWQKLNIINNLYKITENEGIYYLPGDRDNSVNCDAIIGLKSGNISLAIIKDKSYYGPLSSLEKNLLEENGQFPKNRRYMFDVHLIAKKAAFSKALYNKNDILYQNGNFIFNNLPEDIKEMFSK